MKLVLEDVVKEEYLDVNNHMNVVAYYRIFNDASSAFFKYIDFNMHEDEAQPITIFTLESHLTYLKEITEGKKFSVYFRMLDYDEKRLHTFQEMKNEAGEVIATCETMLMAVHKMKRRADRLPEDALASIGAFYEQYKDLPWPQQAGNKIGMKKRSE